MTPEIRAFYTAPSQTATAPPARTGQTDSRPKLPESPLPANDLVTLPALSGQQGRTGNATRLLAESVERRENGLRITRTFEQPEGRQFVRQEDISLTATGMRREVIQQNPSGAFTRYEEVLDREDGSRGTFRRTQRFRDEGGELSTHITPAHQVTDPFVLSGGAVPYNKESAAAPRMFAPSRGTQLDISA